ncbi:MAG: hypothetical protein ACLFMM_05360 [Methanohalobium sp.]|uniref:hypothetical protein n=1 Tax=Methanohalobium sp. TaxID=2837493 RepID=UPI003979AFDE
MKSINIIAVIAIIIIVGLIAVSGAFLNNEPEGDDFELNLRVNASQAIGIVINNTSASDYLSENFNNPDWRVVTASLEPGTVYNLNGTPNQNETNFWKVETMERTCACSGVDDLYVVEGYVSANTGELLEVSTKTVSERNYDKRTCATTSCH